MDAICFSVLLNVKCYKIVFSLEQRVLVVKHYFFTKRCNKVKEQYEKQFPGANLPSNEDISHVIHKFEN